MHKFDLSGRHAVVTGGAQGFGRAITERFLASGASVSIWDMDAAELQKVTSELKGQGTVQGVQVDVSNLEAVEAATRSTIDAHGKIDILVGNAGIAGPNHTLWEYPVAEWKKVIDINLFGLYYTNRAVVPHMLKQGYGRIVNIASVAGLAPQGSSIAYAVSKAGLIHLTRCMAVALAPMVLVNCIAPGYLEDTRATANLDPAYRQRSRQASLLKQAADKDDIANQVVAMCQADTITGQTLVIDAGRVFH